jgi:hypothetical protein
MSVLCVSLRRADYVSKERPTDCGASCVIKKPRVTKTSPRWDAEPEIILIINSVCGM